MNALVMIRSALLASLLLLATPAFAAVDRETAITNLSSIYNWAEVCGLQISRAKVDAYRAANTPPNDALFNVDVFRATHALTAAQKDWTKEQTAAYCKTALESAKTLGVLL